MLFERLELEAHGEQARALLEQRLDIPSAREWARATAAGAAR